MKPNPSEKRDAPEAPAKITDLHVLGRPATDDNMRAIVGRTAWSKLSPLEACYAKDQLGGGNKRYTAQNRLAAGEAYSKLFDMTEKSGTDSTQALNVSRSSSRGYNNDVTDRAWSERLSLESHLNAADRQIITMVCGEGRYPSEAVRAVCNDYKDAVVPRFREALDHLIEAFETARRNPGRFNMERVSNV